MMGCRKMTVYLIAVFASAALWVAAVRTTAAQERAATPAAQHHTNTGSRAPRATADNNEADFIAANDAAMNKMMADMTVAPTGDIDRDFVAMMVPHHQGAIDMALIILRFGKSEQLKRLAQEIIVTQQQEIAAMKLAIGEPLPLSLPTPTQVPASTIPRPASGEGTHMDHTR
jgi:uncharacterized protein (DUF305 family)